MPTADDVDNQISQDSQDSQDAAPAAPAAPAFDASAIGREIVSGLREYALENEARQNARNQPQQQVEQERIINEDDSPALIAEKAAFNAGIPLRRQMAQMQQQFQTVGMGTLEQVSRRQVLDNDPTYKKYKTEVDSRIATLDAATRANPDVLAQVVKMVRSDHVEDEVKERSERLVAAALKAGEGAAPGESSGRSYRPRQDGIPTPEELGYNEEQLRSIEMRGGPDAFARKVSMGRFNNWAEYTKSLAKHQQALKDNKTDHRGAAIPFRRAGDKPRT